MTPFDRPSNNRLLWVILILGALGSYGMLVWNYGGVPTHVKEFKGATVKARAVTTLSGVFLVHESDKGLLFVDGKRFANLRGTFPFFLKAPQDNCIVFVLETSGSNSSKAEIVVFENATRQFHYIPCEGFMFGYGIGFGFERIESFDGKSLVLRSDGHEKSETIRLNVLTREVVSK